MNHEWKDGVYDWEYVIEYEERLTGLGWFGRKVKRVEWDGVDEGDWGKWKGIKLGLRIKGWEFGFLNRSKRIGLKILMDLVNFLDLDFDWVDLRFLLFRIRWVNQDFMKPVLKLLAWFDWDDFEDWNQLIEFSISENLKG